MPAQLPTHRATPRRVAATLAAAATLALAAAAGAAPVLPDATYYSLIGVGQVAQTDRAPGSYQVGNVSSIVTSSPEASLVGHAGGGFLGAMEASLTYSYVVDGAEADLLVPMIATFALGVSATGAPTGTANEVVSNADAELFVGGLNGGFNRSLNATSLGPHPLDIDESVSFNVLAGRVESVSLVIRAGARLDGVAHAFVDPILTIDPVFALSHPGYSVIVSAGIGNAAPVAAVPEPETYALLLAGLAVTGWTARQRRKDASTPV